MNTDAALVFNLCSSVFIRGHRVFAFFSKLLEAEFLPVRLAKEPAARPPALRKTQRLSRCAGGLLPPVL
jgi:hypothetical protein